MNDLKKRFITLYKSTGWTMAQMARKLDMTRGGIHGLIKGGTIPSTATVKLLELVMFSEGILTQDTEPHLLDDKETSKQSGKSWVDELLMNLDDLPDPDRQEVINSFLAISRLRKKRKH